MLKNLCQKMFGRSLWVYHANSGGCNGCDIEVLNVLTPAATVSGFTPIPCLGPSRMSYR
jgi:Ni,Fe-hydrogenase III small subunit